MSTQLTDMQIVRVSTVDKGANRKRFMVFKREPEQEAAMDTPSEEAAGWLRKAADWLLGRNVETDENTDLAKIGRKISAARLERLKGAAEGARSAAQTLHDVLAEVEDEIDDTEKRADLAQEVDMTPEEITTAIADGIAKAMEPFLARLDVVEKREDPDVAAAVEAAQAPLTEVVEKVLDRIEKIETARGMRTSTDGQDGDGVKKSQWAGIF